MPDRHGLAPVPGTALYYEVTGSGPPVVLLHGFSLDLRMWDEQMDAFAKQFTVVRYDLRGFGQSAPSDVPYSHAGDLAILLNHIALTHVSLVGLSMGGGAAINFAISHPKAVRALVPVDSTLGGFQWSPAFTESQKVVYAMAKAGDLPGARAEWLKSAIFRTAMANARSAPHMTAMVGAYSGWHWVNRDPGLAMVPFASERLGEIKAKTLAVIGVEDEPDFHTIADLIVKDVPGARKLEIVGAGHMPPLELPSAFNAAVLEFLSR